MKDKTFKIIYAGVLVFVGIAVIGTIAVNTYGNPICIRQLKWDKSETISIPTGEYYNMQNFGTFILDAVVPPTVIYLIVVFFAGVGVFWFKEDVGNKKKTKHL